MKNLSKLLALLVVLCMVLTVGAFASAEPSAEPSGEASGDAVSVEDAFIDYIHEWLLAELEVNANMTIEQVEDEFMPLVREMNFVDFPAEMIYSGMLEQGVPMTFEEFAAQYVPEEAASAEAGLSVEDAYVEYIHEFLLNELTVNTGGMTIEIIEDEFMPAIEAGKYDEFPADMLYNGMLDSGVAMTFEEFAAQYVPAGAASGGYTADEAGYKAYLKDWVAANPAVQANIDEFNAAIDAGAYADFPLEMCFTDQWFGFAALSLDEFIAAGGVAEIPAFDPNLAPD